MGLTLVVQGFRRRIGASSCPAEMNFGSPQDLPGHRVGYLRTLEISRLGQA
jgi:hypothetical protein